MTVEEVRAWVEEIRITAHDDEKAHGMEDALHQEVLRAVAENAPNAAALAAEALKTRDIDFYRWCA